MISSSGARFENENSSSYPNYINVMISSIFLVILLLNMPVMTSMDWGIDELPPCNPQYMSN